MTQKKKSATPPREIRYYQDPLTDDFAGSRDKIQVETLPDDYRFIHTDPFWKAAAFVAYYGIAAPVVWLYCHLLHGLRIRNKRAVRGLKEGFFLYGNHTQSGADAFIPALIAFPKKNHPIAGPAVVSIPVVRHVVPLLGVLPLPSTLKGMRALCEALERVIRAKQTVTIYPEAHIWPYFTGIRPFSAASFGYPVRLGCPVVGMVVTYRPRRIFKKLPPPITVTLSDPVWPDPAASPAKEKQRIRDEVYAFMCDTVRENGSAEYIAYRPAPGAPDVNIHPREKVS